MLILENELTNIGAKFLKTIKLFADKNPYNRKEIITNQVQVSASFACNKYRS